MWLVHVVLKTHLPLHSVNRERSEAIYCPLDDRLQESSYSDTILQVEGLDCGLLENNYQLGVMHTEHGMKVWFWDIVLLPDVGYLRL